LYLYLACVNVLIDGPCANRTMYICLCNAITEREIAQAVDLGARSAEDLARHLGVGLGCGRCVSCAEEILRQVGAKPRAPEKLAA